MNFKISKMFLAEGLKNLILFELSHYGDDDITVYVEAYQNGREQGVAIQAYRDGTFRSLHISESRNSDQIMMYPNNKAMQGLNDESYKNALCFNPGEYTKAVKDAVEFLRNK